MMVDTQPSAGVPASTMAALMLAVFTVSAGFGVVLPLLSSHFLNALRSLIEVNCEVIHTHYADPVQSSACSLSRNLNVGISCGWQNLANT